MNTPYSENAPRQDHAIYHHPPKNVVLFDYTCNQCNHTSILQADFAADIPLQPGCIAFPDDSRFTCPNCGAVHNLTMLRQDLELGRPEHVQKPLVTSCSANPGALNDYA